jgi:two-component sensor histidine kinase
LVEVSVTISPIVGDAGQIIGASKIMRDITPARLAAEALHAVNAALALLVQKRTAELKEREYLLQEIHHRVKNNLQVISSLISMQIRGLADASSRAALSEFRSRVMTMAQIHEMLYQSADYAQVPFAKYAKDLATRILRASGSASGNIHLHFSMEELSLPVEQAIPCGLILNELVANSLKHAFPNAAQGTIRVELRLALDRSVHMSVSDDGVGISPALNLTTLSSLGVQLVMSLVEQLEGRLEIVRLPGSTFRITFPLDSAP